MLRPTLESVADHGSRRLARVARGAVRPAVTPAASDAPATVEPPAAPATRSAPDTPPTSVTRRSRVAVDHRDDPVARRVFSRAILGGGPGLR